MTTTVKIKVAKRFSQRMLAEVLGTKQQNISRWLNGNIPANKIINLCEAIGWLITPHEIRPDIYPNPTDGLPPGVTVPPPAEQRAEQ